MQKSTSDGLIGFLAEDGLALRFIVLAVHQVHHVPNYFFRMVNPSTEEEFGRINLRLSSDLHIERYSGHIGYSVLPKHRGHHYASRAINLLKPLAREFEFRTLWITCAPENIASRLSCEAAGAVLQEIIEVSMGYTIYCGGNTRICRYKLCF